MVKDLVIYGAGGFANGDLTWTIEDINMGKKSWNLLGYLDDDVKLHGQIRNTYEILGGSDWLNGKKEIYCVIGLGFGNIREKVLKKIKNEVAGFPTLIHPNVSCSRHVEIGAGNMILAGNLISGGAKIKNFVIVNLDCTVGHDVILNDFVTISPGAHLSGFVNVANFGEVGTGANVVQGVTIGENSIIGAGSAVIRDIPAYCTAVGVPAKVIKQSLPPQE